MCIGLFIMLCRSLFVPFSFFFWPLYCLSYFDLRLLITSLWYLKTFLDEGCYCIVFNYRKQKQTNKKITKYTPLGFVDGFRNNIVVDAGTVDVMTQVTRSLVGSVVTMVCTVVSTVVSSVISIANGNLIMLGGWNTQKK